MEYIFHLLHHLEYFYLLSYTNNGQCVLNEICGINCSIATSNNMQFSNILLKNDVTIKNYVLTRILPVIVPCVISVEKFVVHQLIYPWTNVDQQLSVNLLMTRIMSHTHWHTPHLPIATLLGTLAFILGEEQPGFSLYTRNCLRIQKCDEWGSLHYWEQSNLHFPFILLYNHSLELRSWLNFK